MTLERSANKMHLKNILPEEILLQIFSEVDRSDLQKFFEISHEWRNLLIRNVKVMRKLPLLLMNDTWTDKLDFVQNYGKYIRQVDFIGTNIDSYEDVLKVLRLTPNVEKLSLVNLKLAQIENEENLEENVEENFDGNAEQTTPERVELKKLRELNVVDEENTGSLKFIELHCEMKLMSLKCDLIDETQLPIIEQLLTLNNQLKCLEISSELYAVFNPSDEVIERFNLCLEKLVVKGSVMKYNEQFMKFLTSQTHLQEVGLIASHVDFRYHQMMFTTFPCVKKVHLNIDAVGTTDCLLKLNKIPPNKSLRVLTLLGRNLHLNVFEAVLKLCPKINELNITNLTHFYSDKIKTLPLTHLRVDRANSEFLRPESMTQFTTKVKFTDNAKSQRKGVYERNLQSFCDLNRFSDKDKDTNEAFRVIN